MTISSSNMRLLILASHGEASSSSLMASTTVVSSIALVASRSSWVVNLSATFQMTGNKALFLSLSLDTWHHPVSIIDKSLIRIQGIDGVRISSNIVHSNLHFQIFVNLLSMQKDITQLPNLFCLIMHFLRPRRRR